MSLFIKFNLILILVFAVALVPAAYLSNDLLQSNARTQIVQNARIMMQTALATRGYTNKQIKPKEATLNPTNPRDRTVDWEADVVNAFRANDKLTEVTGEREGPLGRSLYLARPIKITDAGCLSCHTTPDVAPASVVKAYGTSNGYGWKLNEIIGAQIVTVPMAVPIRMAHTAFRTLLGSLVGVFVFILLILNVLLWLVVIRPIRKLSSMADAVSTGNFDVPEVAVTGHDEVSVLAGSFNRMRISLAKALKLLEDE